MKAMNRKSFRIHRFAIAIMLGVLSCQGCDTNPLDQSNDGGVHITAPTETQLGQLPPDAAIIFMSSRWLDREQDLPALLQIYAMNEGGSRIAQITYDHPDGTFEHAAVSFDRNFIAANSVDDHTGNSSLWIYDLQNKTKARLVPGFYTAGFGGVDWSPDGFIYFVAREKRPNGLEDLGKQDIFRIRPDGSGLPRVWDGGRHGKWIP